MVAILHPDVLLDSLLFDFYGLGTLDWIRAESCLSDERD